LGENSSFFGNTIGNQTFCFIAGYLVSMPPRII
jgi:hypothetical protein